MCRARKLARKKAVCEGEIAAPRNKRADPRKPTMVPSVRVV